MKLCVSPNKILFQFFRTCNVLPLNCSHLVLWRGKIKDQKQKQVHAKQKGFKNFLSCRLFQKNFDTKKLQMTASQWLSIFTSFAFQKVNWISKICHFFSLNHFLQHLLDNDWHFLTENYPRVFFQPKLFFNFFTNQILSLSFIVLLGTIQNR